MVPSEDGRAGRLCCPNGEPVEHRISGGRWYFNGRQNGLDEPFPPAPEPAPEPAPDLPGAGAGGGDDPLNDALRIVRDAWKDAETGG
jgi:hypothetical protein